MQSEWSGGGHDTFDSTVVDALTTKNHIVTIINYLQSTKWKHASLRRHLCTVVEKNPDNGDAKSTRYQAIF